MQFSTRLTQFTFLLVFCLAIFSARRLAQHNYLSLAYLWHREDSYQSLFVPKPQWSADLVNRHPNLVIWLSRDALGNQELDTAESQISQLVAQGNYDALSLQGEIFAQRGEFAAAMALWREQKDIGAIQRAAREAQKAGQLNNARLAYRTVYELDPEAGAYDWANFQWTQLKETTSAEITLSQMIDSDPNSRQYGRWLHLLGRLFRTERRWNEAMTVYTHLVDRDAGDVTSFIQLGWTGYERDGFVEEAIERFQDAIRANPRRGDGYIAIAQVLTREGRYAEADVWYGEAASRNPASISWALTYAANARRQEKFDVALQRYESAAQQFAESAPVFYELAWAYHQLARTEEAQGSIQKAIELSAPNTPAAYLRRQEAIGLGG